MKSTGYQNVLATVTFALSLFGYTAFAPLIDLFDRDSSLTSILLRVVVILLSVASLARCNPKPSMFNGTGPLILFLSLYAVRLADNFFLREFIWEADASVVFGLYIGGCIIPMLALVAIISDVNEVTLKPVLIILTLFFLLGILLNGGSIFETSAGGRLSLNKLNPISFADFCTNMVLFFYMAKAPSMFWRVTKFLGIGILSYFALLTQSRGPLVAISVALALSVANKEQAKHWIPRASLAVLVLCSVGIGADLVGIDLTGGFFSRFDDAMRGEDVSAEGRVVAWDASIWQFWESPIIGDKVFEPTLLRYPHNLIIETLISLGLMGILLLLVASYNVISRGVVGPMQLKRNQVGFLHRFLILFVVKQFVQAQFSGAIWSNTSLWISAACLVAVANSKKITAV